MISRDVSAAKAALRAAALERRDALDPEWRASASLQVAERALGLPELRDAFSVAGFWPIRSEVDPRPLMAALHDRGQALALPVVSDPHLTFRAWLPGDPLVRRGFGLSEPPETAARMLPDVLLVPLACFDRRGARVGYGKGHYDRTLAALKANGRVVAIGLAFSGQEVESAPVSVHDEPLDIVVTEADVVRVGAPHGEARR